LLFTDIVDDKLKKKTNITIFPKRAIRSFVINPEGIYAVEAE
jgi:hypothetical protein